MRGGWEARMLGGWKARRLGDWEARMLGGWKAGRLGGQGKAPDPLNFLTSQLLPFLFSEFRIPISEFKIPSPLPNLPASPPPSLPASPHPRLPASQRPRIPASQPFLQLFRHVDTLNHATDPRVTCNNRM